MVVMIVKLKSVLLVIVCLSFVLVKVSSVEADLITNPGFETFENTSVIGYPGLPSTYGDWGGDKSAIVSAENGITPYGTQMLRFDATGNSACCTLNSGEVYQWVDLSAYSTEIATGQATASLSAWFNRVAGDSQTDTSFTVYMWAMRGIPPSPYNTNFRDDYLALEGGGVAGGSDANPGTWEQAAADMLLPAGTSYLVVRLTAYENVWNDCYFPEFDGHYADNVSLTISQVPIPGAIWLLGSGLLGIIGLRRKRG